MILPNGADQVAYFVLYRSLIKACGSLYESCRKHCTKCCWNVTTPCEQLALKEHFGQNIETDNPVVEWYKPVGKDCRTMFTRLQMDEYCYYLLKVDNATAAATWLFRTVCKFCQEVSQEGLYACTIPCRKFAEHKEPICDCILVYASITRHYSRKSDFE